MVMILNFCEKERKVNEIILNLEFIGWNPPKFQQLSGIE